MDITNADSSGLESGMITLRLTDGTGCVHVARLSLAAAIRCASGLLFQLAQLPTETGPTAVLQVVSVPCKFAVTVGLPDVQEVVARFGPLCVSLGSLEYLSDYLSREIALLNAAPAGKQ